MTFEEYAALDETDRMKRAVSQLAAVASVQTAVSFDESMFRADSVTISLADLSSDELEQLLEMGVKAAS